QKMRWCPGIGAGAKKLSRGGQKMRWCPGIGAGAKKLSKGGQKLRWCPGIGAGAQKLTTAGQKLSFVPAKLCTNTDFWPLLLTLTGGAAPPLSLVICFFAERRQTDHEDAGVRATLAVLPSKSDTTPILVRVWPVSAGAPELGQMIC
ncbi:MAG: hypothetical protein QM296_11460, partial [Bacillota bacterium]|nr:hypothetical protein [Bacillota bacterium]